MKIIGIIIGLLLIGFGIYYYQKEKKDEESRKIYGITTIVGFVMPL